MHQEVFHCGECAETVTSKCIPFVFQCHVLEVQVARKHCLSGYHTDQLQKITLIGTHYWISALQALKTVTVGRVRIYILKK